MELRICKHPECKKEHDGAQLGKYSYPYFLGYCSTQCYTRAMLYMFYNARRKLAK